VMTATSLHQRMSFRSSVASRNLLGRLATFLNTTPRKHYSV
jgi:hypothetical protein